MNTFFINLKARIKNWAWWATAIPAFFALVSMILRACNVYKDFTDIQNSLLAIGESIFAIMAMLGVNVDPTTKGISDSPLAMTYSAPKDDKAAPKPVEKPTTESIIANIVATAQAQEGYLGKKTADNLDDKKANPGGKFTLFAKELDDDSFFNTKKNGYDYCCVGAIWSFFKVLGKEKTYKLFGIKSKSSNYTAAVDFLYKGLLNAGGKVVKVPQAGDIEVQGDFDHVTIVSKYDGEWVSNVSFNSEDDKGQSYVGCFKHGVAHPGITYYVRPNWDLLKED